MSAPDLLNELRRMGLRLSAQGSELHVGPRAAITEEARRLIRDHKPEILKALTGSEEDTFSFTPPGDPANDDEALQERVAIMIEANGMDEATALQEARWQADRERCWRGVLRNAARVLEAPLTQREGLLVRFEAEATGRYGRATGAAMAEGLRSWVTVRGMH